MCRRSAVTFAGITCGVIADRLFADPFGQYHPVAIFGRYVQHCERLLYAPTKTRGALFLLVTTAPPVALSILAARKAPTLTLAASVATSLGGTTLVRIGNKMVAALDGADASGDATAPSEAGDLRGARALIPWLCSRDPEQLDGPDIVRATVESLAENTSDAAIAPLVWAGLGAPWVVLHRCVNTLDAMVGYRNERYEEFGWAAAKLDDVLAYLPARLTGLAHYLVALPQGRGEQVLEAWRTQAKQHPSPNAGVVEATAAAALGVRLGGVTHYAHGTEQRPELGFGAAPTTQDITRAAKLSTTVQTMVAAGVIAGASVAQQLWSKYRGQRK